MGIHEIIKQTIERFIEMYQNANTEREKANTDYCARQFIDCNKEKIEDTEVYWNYYRDKTKTI